MRPTRVCAKFGGFHISVSGHAKNAPDFTFPNRDTYKTYPVLGANRRRRTFGGVCFCAPTRVREKPGGFHISAHEYAKNAPDFTFPNKDTPKAHPVLDPNHRRGTFRGVCNTPLHGYTQNLPGFRPKPSARIFLGRMQYAPTRVHEKPARFHISPSGYAKNAPDFTLSNKDTPKSCPVLGANLRRGYLRGVCNTPLHGYMKNLAGFIFPHPNTPKTHLISLYPIRTAPKTCPVLGPNRRRGSFRGVCFCALHGYVQNPPGFIFPHMYPPKTHPISPIPIRIYPKPARF